MFEVEVSQLVSAYNEDAVSRKEVFSVCYH